MALVTVLLPLVIVRPSTVTWALSPMVCALVVPGASLRAVARVPVSLMSMATAPVSFLVRMIVSLVRSTDAIRPAFELLIRVTIVDRESEVVS